MRVLAESEVQFEVFADLGDEGPEGQYDEAEDGWWTVTVRAMWWSPGKRPYSAGSSVSSLPLTETYTAEVVSREAQLRGAALDNLNEKLRELFLEAQGIREYLERGIFEVRAGGSMEGLFPAMADAERHAEQLRKEVGAQQVEVVPTSAEGKVRDLLEPPRMLPGQAPYSPEELAKLERLVGDAAEATEAFDEDELEWQARVARRSAPEPEPEWDDATMGGRDRFEDPQ